MKLDGKTINFLGDSITEGHGVANLENRYDNVIKKAANLKAANNYGIGGTRIAYQSKPSDCPEFDLYFCGRARKMSADADIIVVFGGTNDYGHGDAPFGTVSDTTPSTYCGAVEFLMNSLKDTFPQAQIVFMTPARRKNDLLPGSHPYKIADAKPLKDYVDVIKIKAAKHCIPVLDLYENLGINPNNEDELTKYAPDGLHFNDDGHAIIAELLMDFLAKI